MQKKLLVFLPDNQSFWNDLEKYLKKEENQDFHFLIRRCKVLECSFNKE